MRQHYRLLKVTRLTGLAWAIIGMTLIIYALGKLASTDATTTLIFVLGVLLTSHYVAIQSNDFKKTK